VISWFAPTLVAGGPAPDFALSDADGRTVRLSDFRGRHVVLVFYPGDDTPVCTRQLCEFRDHWEELQRKNVAVLGINPWSRERKAKFARKYSFPFPLLRDPGQRAAARYHANGPRVRRTVYVVGPDGAIRYAQRGKPSFEDVLAAVDLSASRSGA
jgi:peroxiredoxin Q/BCP